MASMQNTKSVFVSVLLAVLTVCGAGSVLGQVSNSTTLPKEVCGYKVHRAHVEPVRTTAGKTGNRANDGVDEYDEDEPLSIRLGEPELVKVSPLGVTFDIPVILPPVKQQGDIERLVFAEMLVNETHVSIQEHSHKFKLPNKAPLTLRPPIRIFVSTPQAVVRTIDEIFNSKETWPVTGTIYVCGSFKKFLLKFKRAVPVEIQTSIRNPLR